MSAFQDSNTLSTGICYLVQVDFLFHQQINEASILLSKSRPENVRQSYITSFTSAATSAAPPPPPSEEDDNEEEEELDEDGEPLTKSLKKPTPDSPETLASKRKVFKDLIASLKGIKLDLSDKEFEGLTTLLVAILYQLYSPTSSSSSSSPAPEEFSSLLLALSDSFTFTPTPSTTPSLSARYSSLSLLFNSLPTSSPSSLKLSILLKLITYAASNDDLAVIEKPLSKFISWVTSPEWALEEEEKVKAVNKVVEVLKGKGKNEEARVLGLEFFKVGKKEEGEGRKVLASEVIALTLGSSSSFDIHSLSTLPTPSSSALASLLSTFLTTSTTSSSSSTTLEDFPVELSEKWGLNKESVERKLKLFKLTEVCSEKVGKVVTYKEIGDAVGVDGDSEEVEIWVIDAIRASLLTGRLSQPTQTFFVTSALPRSFEKKHWKVLEERLEGWKKALEGIRESIKKGQIGGAGGGKGEGRKEEKKKDVETEAKEVEA